MNKFFVSILVCFTLNSFCQDTIYKKNGEIINAKVFEISDANVKFKKANNPNGPVYSELKSNLLVIKYANGSVDSIGAVSTSDYSPIVEYTNIAGSKSQINNIPYYISNDELYVHISRLPSSEAKTKLLKDYKEVVNYKSNQQLSYGLGFGVGFAVPVFFTAYGLGIFPGVYPADSFRTIVVGAILGAAIRITGSAIGKVNRNKAMHKKEGLIRNYNDL